MAEFALGLTKTAVEGMLSLVKSAVEEEKLLRDKVQNDLVFITGEFEVMQSFLQVANREHAANDKVALTLVRQLRTLAFDVEDCVEYVVHLDLDKPSRWAWLRRLWQTVNCRAPPPPLDAAVDEIKQLKARVEDMSQRNTRYNLIVHSSDNSSRQQLLPVMEPPPYAAATDPSPAVFRFLRNAWQATGKWCSNMFSLQQELLMAKGDHDLRVISVWGSGGSTTADDAGHGTASIFTEAYCDPEIHKSFKIRAWVKVTHPFNHDEFVKSLLAQFYASSSHEASNPGVDFCAWMKTEGSEADNLMKANNFMQQTREQRYLVVLEDVLTVAEWDVIRMYLPDSKNGSRILLSTPHLGIALLCTGEPYQVSQLRSFSSDNQFLCAFSRKEKTARDVGEFYHQLLQGHGVISVWGADDDDKSNLVDILYKGIINGWLEEIEGNVDKSDHVDMLYKGIRNRRRVITRDSSWVDVPYPFNLKVFAQRLFLNFHSDDIKSSKITEVGRKGEAGLIQWCRKFLSGGEGRYPYVVVISGLQSKGDWDLIQSTFFSSKATRAKAGCILVITKEETVATHCVKDHTHLAFNAQDLKADPYISSLINKGCWHYDLRFRGKRGRLFYDRRKYAQEWANKLKNVGGIINPDEGKDDDEEGFRVFPVNVDSYYEKSVLRHAYYGALFQQQIERRSSWVDLHRRWKTPLNLTDFSWQLLLDFYSDDPQAKETLAVDLMEGTIVDPIEKCREFLHKEKCLVVIDGLTFYKDGGLTVYDWDLIIDTFFSDEQHIQSILIVGATHMTDRARAEYKCYDTHEQGRLVYMEYCRTVFPQKRYQELIQWAERQCQPVGRDWELRLLNEFVSLDGQSLASVWGIPGVGISALVRAAYYNEIIHSSQLGMPYDFTFSFVKDFAPTEAFAWVRVPSPFSLTEFAWRLFLDFYSDDPWAKETATVSMMKQGRQVPILECCKILRTGKCLVVMDGLHSKQDWDLIKATFLAEPINEEGAIVVITKEEEVAMHCVENDKERTINITRLEAHAALSILNKIASEAEGLKGLTTSEKMELSKYVGKCGGLPKVIVTIGEVCSSDRSWALRSLSRDFMGTLETAPEFHGLRPLFSWMQSYFDACSDSIKPCIFYLSIFDAEKNIRRRRLLWRWIAEGYCRDTSDGRTCEENGEGFIFDLVKLSIIQVSAGNNGVLCQINGFFHEYIISRPMEDNLVFALEKGCTLNSARAGQHLTIRSTWDRTDKIVYESIDFSRLRSLTVAGKWEPFFISSTNINMRLLRVLDLEDATHITNEDLEQIAMLLTRLKFLSLRGQPKINCLPISMGGLRQLQTLDIRGTSIVTLPLFITKLQKLRYIRAGTISFEAWDWALLDASSSSPSVQAVTNLPAAAVAATPNEGGTTTDSTAQVLPTDAAGSLVSYNNRPHTPNNLVSSLLSMLCRSCGGLDNNGPAAGVKVPAGIKKLAVLHTLGVVNVNVVTSSAKSIFFEELKKLTQLCKLGVSGINKGNIHDFCRAISGHGHLRSLSVELDKDDNLDGLDDIPEPPKTIQSLKLYGRVKKLLVWIEKLRNNLEKLKLDLTIEKPEELRDLEFSTRPIAGHLRIKPIQDGDLHFGSGWVFATWIVEIQCSSILHIKFEDQDDYALWKLQVLKVHFSGGSQPSLQISGLCNLGNLEEVWFKGYTDAHKQYMQQQIDDMELGLFSKKKPVLKLVQPRLF